MLSLQVCCLLELRNQDWSIIDPCIKHCLFPGYQAICSLQRKLVYVNRRKMKQVDAFCRNLKGLLMKPMNYNIEININHAWEDELSPGEHLVIPLSEKPMFLHHGILISKDKVVHFTRDCETGELKIIQDTLSNFFGKNNVFYIVPYENTDYYYYTNNNTLSEKDWRNNTVNLAILLTKLSKADLFSYQSLWNCECFAWACKTGGLKCSYDQVKDVMEFIERNIRKTKYSFILRTIALQCVIM